LNDYFNPLTNYQVLAPLWNEDMVITTQAIVVGTKEVLQTQMNELDRLLDLVH